MQPELVLASGSPRRRELLALFGVDFRVQTSHVDETVDHRLPPGTIVEELALRKARAVATECDDALVIGGDTIVVHNGEILGKPCDEDEAKKMLSRLQGTDHQVYSGIALVRVRAGAQVEEKTAHRMTRVWMRPLSPEKIAWYVGTKEPLDKAGAYGIQGRGARLVDKIEGCYFNVVGLSIPLLDQMLEEMGFHSV
ncbi:nucleoside triphosphate pyrophosphatase [Thermoactinomyces sp. CICC 10523]|uniref:Maf family protein n=1 Tax=Thermoactinomyces sp. CICC 10523 TaxID=2767428 RepID=UPI0018DE40D5|nr:Maf family protein [Thermoactinomyces sp. CICC 10523]MBH8596865.1 septum formation inhibitor Maf [Thermoactinomyces sp. CICC 10523]